MPNLTRRALLGGIAAPAILCGQSRRRPNILFAIADDQSWLSTSAAGDAVVKTPNFDRVARDGVLFTQAISGSPGCAPSRAAILTGRPHWQLEEAGTHGSLFPAKLQVYPSLLAEAGYHVGMTGKGAGPCDWEASGWKDNPAGTTYNRQRVKNPPAGINRVDYAANFDEFLAAKPKDKPFCFWYGGHEPHRTYDEGSGLRAGKKLEEAKLPPFLPDVREVRSDLLDYYHEIEYFDAQLGRMLRALERAGEIENTLVVATADNGMSFPRSKANLYEYGIHLPLAVAWPATAKGGRVVDDIVSFTDYAPTFLEAAGVVAPRVMTGRSFLDVLRSGRSGRVDDRRIEAYSGRERHSHARFDNLGYPCRALRTHEFLYIRNFKPDRWPAGDPEHFADIDDGPSKRRVLSQRDKFFELACGKRPAEELFEIQKDPGCMRNLAASASHATVRGKLRAALEKTLRDQKDSRMLGTGDVWESYPRFGNMRPELGGFSTQGEYNKKYR